MYDALNLRASFLSAPRAGRRVLLALYTTMWSLLAVELVAGVSFLGLGLQPRTLAGLLGILSSPLVHGGLLHLLCNTLFGVPLAVAAMRRSVRDFYVVTVLAWITGGVGTWLLGAPSSVHVGFSGVLYGYAGFLFGMGLWGRNDGGPIIQPAALVPAVLISLLPGVSLTGHLFGFLGGLLAARLRLFGRRWR